MAARFCLLLFLRFLLFHVPAASAALTCTGPDFCVLNCAGCTPGEMVPDPTECTRFYVCDNGSLMYPDSFECDGETVFDRLQQECTTNATCVPCPSVCMYECTNPNINNEVSSFYDCSIYYPCNGDVPGDSQSCPSSAPYYDGISCQTNRSRCCQCILSCHLDDKGHLIPDPIDCRRYYYCNTDGVLAGSHTCSSGQNFDSYLQSCSSSAPCDTHCKNFVGEDGCIDLYTCEAAGSFPKCPGQCAREYYQCTEVSNEYIEASSCRSGQVFHPDFFLCVVEDQCPY